jgi:hypothetical protein
MAALLIIPQESIIERTSLFCYNEKMNTASIFHFKSAKVSILSNSLMKTTMILIFSIFSPIALFAHDPEGWGKTSLLALFISYIISTIVYFLLKKKVKNSPGTILFICAILFIVLWIVIGSIAIGMWTWQKG